MITVCGWCPNLNILKLQRREQDTVIVFQRGKRVVAMRNGEMLTVSHGICEPCKAKHFPARRQDSPKEGA